MRRTGWGWLLVVPCAAAPLAAEVATYKVKFRFEGATGVYYSDPPGCPSTPRTGFDQYEGEIKGDESAFATNQEVVYRGVLKRTTEIDACDLLPEDADGVANYCNVHVTGGGEYDVKLSVYADRTEVYFQSSPRPGKVRYTANGSCLADVIDGYRYDFAERSDGIEHWIGPRKYSEGMKVGGPPKQGVYQDQPPFPPHNPGHWTLTVGPPSELKADAGGPYTIERGTQVTLDASRSTAAAGHQLVDYSWELTPLETPEGCTGLGQRKTLSGVTVSFVALCTVEAKLTVRQDDQQQDDDDAAVTVKVRPWKTTFDTAKAVDCSKSFGFAGGPGLSTAFAFGYNRCSRKDSSGNEHFDPDENHWYEPEPGTNSKSNFEEGTFWLGEVTDDGPFAGIFYVSKGDFAIQRARWVNKKLCENGEVWAMNQTTPRRVEGWPSRRAVDCKFGKAEMQRLLESVEKHEQIHSDLAKAALRQMKDPATDIEQSLDKDRAKLKDRVNLFVSTAVSEMSNATVEDLVKAVMRGIPRYVDGACFDFPAWDSGLRDDECFYEFGSLADKVQ